MDNLHSTARVGGFNEHPDHARDSDMSLMLGKAMMRLLSPGGKHGLSIFIYHRVLPCKDPLFPGEVDSAEFDRDLRRIASMFNVIPLLDAVRHSAAGTLPPRAACITFDDGYADNAEVALPVLQRHRLPATFFIATGFLNGGRMWNDSIIELVRRAPDGALDFNAFGLGIHPVTSVAERQAAIKALIGQLKYLPMGERLHLVNRLVDAVGIALPTNLMMTTSQVLQLHLSGMGIGAHTVNHPILASIDLATARAEIAQGKQALEDMIGQKVPLFAYPNGKPDADYRAEHVALVKELGFEGAVSTTWGACKGAPDVFQLPRFSPWDRTALRFALRMARNLSKPATFARS
ncbi:MAG: polysaccharide deacetylase family protein [Massilia sp.]|nr:polysaccharide deacetylase family protein [Massilia sp.]